MVLKLPPRCRGASFASAALAAGLIASNHAAAQENRAPFSVRALPRPGYEPVTHHLGKATVELNLDTIVTYDSNIYALTSNEMDDFVLEALPQVTVSLAGARLSVQGEVHAAVREYTKHDTESATTFGGALSGRVLVGPRANARMNVRFDRAVESRTDPESRNPIFVPPSRSNILSGNLAFDTGGSRIALLANVGADRVNFLSRADDDRDLTTLRGSLRMSLRQRSSLALFTEVFATKRNFDTNVDMNGVNRDAVTYGAQAGVSRELTGRLRGSIGAGVFRFDPDDATLQRFTGFGLNGAIYWSPRDRTVISAALFRGDVATVRSGASGRTDTRLSLSIEQEIRHNLLLNAGVSWTRNQYRGSPDGSRSTYSGQVELERLLNRRFSLFGSVSASKRTAARPFDEFSKYRISFGLRARI